MAKKKVVMKKEEKVCKHSKPTMIISSLVIIALGIWTWMTNPTIIKLIAILLVIIGIKKLIWTMHGNCCK